MYIIKISNQESHKMHQSQHIPLIYPIPSKKIKQTSNLTKCSLLMAIDIAIDKSSHKHINVLPYIYG